jgi:hypothetical protein
VTVTSVIAVAGAPGVAHASSDRVTAREATAALATVGDLLTDTTDTSTSTATDAVVTDTVAIPRRAADGVEFNGLTIGLPGAADDAPAVTLDAGTVVYPSPGRYANAVQATDDGGVRALVVIEHAGAPTEYRFPITGATHLSANPDGTISVHRDDTHLATVAPPWARDRNGAAVPTDYRIDGTTITQTIHHTGAAFPVVADPKISWGWRSTTVFFNKTETNHIALGIGVASALLGSRFPPLVIPFGVLTAYAAWVQGAGACLRVIVNHLNPWTPYVLSHYNGGNCK